MLNAPATRHTLLPVRTPDLSDTIATLLVGYANNELTNAQLEAELSHFLDQQHQPSTAHNAAVQFNAVLCCFNAATNYVKNGLALSTNALNDAAGAARRDLMRELGMSLDKVHVARFKDIS